MTILEKAQQMIRVCLYFVAKKGEYTIATDSGGRQRYIVGRLDNDEVFVEKVPKNNLGYVYDLELQ